MTDWTEVAFLGLGGSAAGRGGGRSSAAGARHGAPLPAAAETDSEGLDRAAQLRADAGAVAALLAGRDARVLPVWRGLVPIRGGSGTAGVPGGGSATLGWCPPGHSIFEAAAQPPILLGRATGGGPAAPVWFARDISAWQPPVDPAAAGVAEGVVPVHPHLPPDTALADLRGAMATLGGRDAELAATARAIAGWHSSHGYCAACGGSTLPAQAGWRRDCPACGAHHFPRTDPVAIMLVTRGNRALIGRSPGWAPGMYSCLAGFVEPGETVEAAVRREVAEETRIPIGEVRYVASQPWPFPASLMLGCTAEALGEEIALDPVELEDALWIEREALAEVLAGTHATIRPPRRGAIARHLLRRWLADRRD